MLLCTYVVGTAVWYVYSLLLACSCALVVLVQYGIYTRSCSVALKAYSCALAALSSLVARSHALGCHLCPWVPLEEYGMVCGVARYVM